MVNFSLRDRRDAESFHRYRRDALVNALQMRIIDGFRVSSSLCTFSLLSEGGKKRSLNLLTSYFVDVSSACTEEDAPSPLLVARYFGEEE
jgi:hypothetical protein